MDTIAGMTDLQIKLLTAIGQIAVACIVGYIAYQQWRTAQKKLKAEIFDRRFAAYRRLSDDVQVLLNDDDADDDPISISAHKRIDSIRRTSMEMKWLFSSSIAEIAGRIPEHCNELLAASIPDMDGFSGENTQLLEQFLAAHAQVTGEMENLMDALAPYLKLDH